MKKFSITLVTIVGLSLMASAQRLEEYYEIAAANNPGLQAKYKNFEAAMQRVPQVGSLPDPNVTFGYFLSPVETRVGPQRAKLSLTQMFPWFGTLNAQEDAATLMAKAMYHAFLDERNKLYYQVSAAYFPLYEVQKRIVIEQENLRILSSYKQLATVQYKNGNGALVDVLRVDIMLNDAITELSILNQRIKPLATRFNKILNRNEDEFIEISNALDTSDLAWVVRKDSLLEANPLLQELDLKIQASKSQERAAIKQGLPKFGIGVDYVVVGERTDMEVAGNGRDVLMPMATMSLPIFRGKYRAAKEEALRMQESYAFQKVDVSNNLLTSYQKTVFEIQQHLELIQLYEEQISLAQQSLDLLFSAFGNAGNEFEEILRMQQQILKYQKLKLTATTSYLTALAELDYITAKTK
ncbi:MAG: TolC family protein [Cryomorphaceae bacterium]